ncbi:MAG: dienelactone hydrolase family protein, partial [Alphaproteobacteria bacterium]|nr:dienelactone hydrolase family protein [Alphaproteobacteria bacterium]
MDEFNRVNPQMPGKPIRRPRYAGRCTGAFGEEPRMRRTIFIDPNGKRGMSGELFEAGDSPNGATVLLPHIWGLDADMAAHAERLAATGTRVLVPDLFWRDGRDALDRNDASQREAAATRLRAFDVDAGIADMSVGIEFLRALARPGGPITALGYCFG